MREVIKELVIPQFIHECREELAQNTTGDFTAYAGTFDQQVDAVSVYGNGWAFVAENEILGKASSVYAKKDCEARQFSEHCHVALVARTRSPGHVESYVGIVDEVHLKKACATDAVRLYSTVLPYFVKPRYTKGSRFKASNDRKEFFFGEGVVSGKIGKDLLHRGVQVND